MKTLQIVSKQKADAMLVESLFKPVNGRTLSKMKWCNGKYNTGIKHIGREIEVSDDVVAVYAQRSKDNDGPYIRLMCLYKSNA